MQDGIEVVDQWAKKGHQRGKRWLFRAWDPHSRGWKSKAFAERVAGEASPPEKGPGWTWAKEQRSLLTLQLTTSGSLPFAVVTADYVSSLKGAGRNERYIAEVDRVATAAVAAGAVDMKADRFQDQVRDWLIKAPSFCEGKENPGHITKNRWLVMLKSIAKLGVTKFGLRTNPLTGIKRFKVDKRVKNPLRIGELRAMVGDERAGDAYFRQACLLVYAGLRADEGAHVRWEWIDYDAETITLRVIRDQKGKVLWAPKGNKERVIGLQPELAELLQGWRREVIAEHGTARGWVIGDGGLRKLEDKGHWKAFRAYLGRCGIDGSERDLSPHSTRHTWAAVMLATGASPTRIRRMLGHEKLSTTDIYADAEALFEKVVKDWPRGVMCLRHQPAKPIDIIALLRAHLGAGRQLTDLASLEEMLRGAGSSRAAALAPSTN